MENAILLDSAFYKNTIWDLGVDKIDLSEQFMMSTNFAGKYCSGGDFSIAVNNLLTKGLTVELEKNYEYYPDYYESMFTAQQPLAPKIAEKDYLKPFKEYKNYDDGQRVGAVHLAFDKPGSFSAGSIRAIKSYLSRGIAVAGYLFTAQETDDLEFYSGGGVIQHSPCAGGWVNHQVVFAGYGRKGGRDVWLVKNSWGAGWGDRGFFFAEIGRDSFCLEHMAFSAVPLHYAAAGAFEYPRPGRRDTWELDEEAPGKNSTAGIVVGAMAGVFLAAGVVILGLFWAKKKGKIGKQKNQGFVPMGTGVLNDW